MRGAFQRADGLILPNNISKAGAKMILEAAFRNTEVGLFVGLVTGAPSADMTMANMQEPAIGTFGYARIGLTRDEAGWPLSDEAAGERYLSTDWLLWTAVGGNFSKPIQRLVLLGSSSAVGSETPVFALSSPLPEEFVITPDTPEAQRRFKYTIYL